MNVTKVVVSTILAVVLSFAPAISAKEILDEPTLVPTEIGNPGGFNNKVYNSAFALYVSSVEMDRQDRFICTVTAYKKVKHGYMLIGAGHCTSANMDLPEDLTYGVAEQIGGKVMPVRLLKAVMREPLDYAIYYFETKNKYPTIDLGDENLESIGDKTVNANFSLGVVKMVSEGVIASKIIDKSGDAHGFYLVAEFDSHGASGSAIVSKKNHKIIGLVIAGWDGATMPACVTPISVIEKEIAKNPVIVACSTTKECPDVA